MIGMPTQEPSEHEHRKISAARVGADFDDVEPEVKEVNDDLAKLATTLLALAVLFPSVKGRDTQFLARYTIENVLVQMRRLTSNLPYESDVGVAQLEAIRAKVALAASATRPSERARAGAYPDKMEAAIKQANDDRIKMATALRELILVLPANRDALWGFQAIVRDMISRLLDLGSGEKYNIDFALENAEFARVEALKARAEAEKARAESENARASDAARDAVEKERTETENARASDAAEVPAPPVTSTLEVVATLPSQLLPGEIRDVILDWKPLVAHDSWLGFEFSDVVTDFSGKKYPGEVPKPHFSPSARTFYNYGVQWLVTRDDVANMLVFTSETGERISLPFDLKTFGVLHVVSAGEFLALATYRIATARGIVVEVYKKTGGGQLRRLGFVPIVIWRDVSTKRGLAIDNAGNVWCVSPFRDNSRAASVVVRSSSGVVVGERRNFYPIALAASPDGGMWVAVDVSNGERDELSYEHMRVAAP